MKSVRLAAATTSVADTCHTYQHLAPNHGTIIHHFKTGRGNDAFRAVSRSAMVLLVVVTCFLVGACAWYFITGVSLAALDRRHFRPVPRSQR